MNAAVAALCERLDVHVELLDTLVGATQEQLQGLLGYRPDGRESAATLAAVNDRIKDLIAAVDHHSAATREAAETVADAFSVPLDDATGLSQLAERLPAEHRAAILERVSCVQALAGSLRELSHVNQLHARRGLQVVAAWWSIVGDGESAPATYTAKGRAHFTVPTSTGSLTLNI